MYEKLTTSIDKEILTISSKISEIDDLCIELKNISKNINNLKDLKTENFSGLIDDNYINELNDYKYLLSLKYVKTTEKQKEELTKLIENIESSLSNSEEKSKYDKLNTLKYKIANLEKGEYITSEEIDILQPYIESNLKNDSDDADLYSLIINSLENAYNK